MVEKCLQICSYMQVSEQLDFLKLQNFSVIIFIIYPFKSGNIFSLVHISLKELFTSYRINQTIVTACKPEVYFSCLMGCRTAKGWCLINIYTHRYIDEWYLCVLYISYYPWSIFWYRDTSSQIYIYIIVGFIEMYEKK